MKKNIELEEITKYDYLKFNKKKWLPDFLMRERNKEEEKTIKAKIEDGFIEVSKKYHIEKFFINIERLLNDSVLEKKEGYVIFDIENDKEIYLFHE